MTTASISSSLEGVGGGGRGWHRARQNINRGIIFPRGVMQEYQGLYISHSVVQEDSKAKWNLMSTLQAYTLNIDKMRTRWGKNTGKISYYLQVTKLTL